MVSIWFCQLRTCFFSSCTSITFLLPPSAPRYIQFDISSTLFLYWLSSFIPAISFLSSLSAAFPSLPSQSASHCRLHGVVMVTMATDFKWRVAHRTALGVFVCGGGYRGRGTTVQRVWQPLHYEATHHWLLSLSHTNMHLVHVNMHKCILMLECVCVQIPILYHTCAHSHALNMQKLSAARALVLRGLPAERLPVESNTK